MGKLNCEGIKCYIQIYTLEKEASEWIQNPFNADA